jgi:hypothetical protein
MLELVHVEPLEALLSKGRLLALPAKGKVD